VKLREILSERLAGAIIALAAVIPVALAAITMWRYLHDSPYVSRFAYLDALLLAGLAVGVYFRLGVCATILVAYFLFSIAYELARGGTLSHSLLVDGLVIGIAAIVSIKLYPRRVRSQ
jgi:hypothetical protein